MVYIVYIETKNNSHTVVGVAENCGVTRPEIRYNFSLRRNCNFFAPVLWIVTFYASIAKCPVAVPEKIIGLTLILDFFDRCTRCALALSATGSAQARGPSGIPLPYGYIP